MATSSEENDGIPGMGERVRRPNLDGTPELGLRTGIVVIVEKPEGPEPGMSFDQVGVQLQRAHSRRLRLGHCLARVGIAELLKPTEKPAFGQGCVSQRVFGSSSTACSRYSIPILSPSALRLIAKKRAWR